MFLTNASVFLHNKTFLHFFAFSISRSRHGILSASVPVFLPQLSVHGRPDSLCNPSPSPYPCEVRLKCHVISSASMLSVSTLDKDSLGGAGGGAGVCPKSGFFPGASGAL